MIDWRRLSATFAPTGFNQKFIIQRVTMNSFRPAGIKMRIAGLTLCLSLLFISALPAAEYASVKKNGVNVRSGPSTTDEVRWEIFKDFPLEILQREKEWVNCLDFEGDKGWVYSDLLSPKKTVIVKKEKINLRNMPETGDNSRIIALVKYGVVFDVIGKNGEWLEVRHEDSTQGWVHKDLVWPSDPLD
jgi:SH3-like domain-containing protein